MRMAAIRHAESGDSIELREGPNGDVRPVRVPGRMTELQWGAGGRWLYYHTGSSLFRIDVSAPASHEIVADHLQHARPTSFAANHASGEVAVLQRGSVKLWSPSSPGELPRMETDPAFAVEHLVWCDERTLATVLKHRQQPANRRVWFVEVDSGRTYSHECEGARQIVGVGADAHLAVARTTEDGDDLVTVVTPGHVGSDVGRAAEGRQVIACHLGRGELVACDQVEHSCDPRRLYLLQGERDIPCPAMEPFNHIEEWAIQWQGEHMLLIDDATGHEGFGSKPGGDLLWLDIPNRTVTLLSSHDASAVYSTAAIL